MTIRTADPVLEAILALAAKGVRVFPCDPMNKRPLVGVDRDRDGKPIEGSGWPRKASSDADRIRAWRRKWPDCLWATSPGWSGFLVVDLDPKGEPVEAVEARLVEAMGEPLPAGPRTITQSGGRHAWLAKPKGASFGNHPPGVRNVDIRGDGGYVILPPSVMASGAAYAWEGENPFVAGAPLIPTGLVDCIHNRKPASVGSERERGSNIPQTRGAAPRGGAGDDPAAFARRRYALAALDAIGREIAGVGAGQGRGTALYGGACMAGRYLAAGDISEREALAVLQDAADACGLTRDDGGSRVDRDIRRGLDLGQGDAAEILARMAEIGREAAEKAARRAKSSPRPPEPPPIEDVPEWVRGGQADRGGAEIDDDVGEVDETGEGDGELPPDIASVAAAAAELDQNDTDNGRRLLMNFGREIVHVREIGWHDWTGTHWNVDGGVEAVERRAQETARRIRLEAIHIHHGKADQALVEAAKPLAGLAEDGLSEADKLVLAQAKKAAERLAKRRTDRRKFSISCGNRNRTMAMIAQALPHRSVPPADLDADPMLFNVANGTLRFRRSVCSIEDPDCPDPDIVRMIDEVTVDVQLCPHRRDDMIAKIAPVAYDPAARCPRFDRFLMRFQPDPTQRIFLQTAAGRGLLGGASTQVLVYLWGDGANGKSAFMETLARLLGDYAGRLKPESISGLGETAGDKATPDFARLAGKRFVAIAELPRGAPLKEGLVKTMTGGEPIPVRHLNKGFFDLLPEFIPLMSGNDLPEVGGLDHGIWRRLKFVHWPVTLDRAEQRPLQEVVAAFLEEAPGILNWLVEGARRFLAEGLLDPDSIVAAGEAHRDDLDPVGAFVKACVRRSDLPGAIVQARTLFRAFESFCHANAIRPWKETAFGRAMKKKGFVREDRRIREWVGIELVDVPAPPDRAPRSPEDGDPGP